MVRVKLSDRKNTPPYFKIKPYKFLFYLSIFPCFHGELAIMRNFSLEEVNAINRVIQKFNDKNNLSEKILIYLIRPIIGRHRS